jgi:hypothetical protein
MSIVSDQDMLSFMGTSEEIFIINASCDSLILKYDSGVATTVDIPDGTYDGPQLATAAQTAINSAFAISCTVSWSPTTRLFTFTVPAGGHTFALTFTGSEAAANFGFDQDHTAAATLTSDNACGDPTAMILAIRDATEVAIENYCRRSFMTTSYTLEKYSGNGTSYIYLKNYPVTAVTLVSIGVRDAMYVWNTSKTSFASVSVSSTGLILSRDGTTDSSPTFAANTTLSALVDAINLVGSGWAATIASSDYNNFKSSFLLSKWGLSVIDSNYVYLKIPDVPQSDFELDENNGIIKLSCNVSNGFKNVFVSYVAGYSVAPADLQYAIKVTTKAAYGQQSSDLYGVTKFSIGDLSYSFGASSGSTQNTIDPSMIPEVRDILAKYRKLLV